MLQNEDITLISDLFKHSQENPFYDKQQGVTLISFSIYHLMKIKNWKQVLIKVYFIIFPMTRYEVLTFIISWELKSLKQVLIKVYFLTINSFLA